MAVVLDEALVAHCAVRTEQAACVCMCVCVSLFKALGCPSCYGSVHFMPAEIIPCMPGFLPRRGLRPWCSPGKGPEGSGGLRLLRTGQKLLLAE
jgi:hypothetical protein